jgi:hypothetical protein
MYIISIILYFLSLYFEVSLMAFGVPKQIDNFLTLGYLSLFLVSFMINTSMCGSAVVNFYNVTYHISPDLLSQNSSTSSFALNVSNPSMAFGSNVQNQFNYYISSSAQSYSTSSHKAFYLGLFIYWFLIPALCFYYAFFVFKKSMWEKKSLNTSIDTNINRGVKNG